MVSVASTRLKHFRRIFRPLTRGRFNARPQELDDEILQALVTWLQGDLRGGSEWLVEDTPNTEPVPHSLRYCSHHVSLGQQPLNFVGVLRLILWRLKSSSHLTLYTRKVMLAEAVTCSDWAQSFGMLRASRIWHGCVDLQDVPPTQVMCCSPAWQLRKLMQQRQTIYWSVLLETR